MQTRLKTHERPVKGGRKRCVALLVAALTLAPVTGEAALAGTGGPQGAHHSPFWPARHASNNHCITPAGTDANEVLGVREQIVVFDAPPEAGCGPVSTGEFWIPIGPALGWITNTSFEIVPAGYEPSAATPMRDFVSKARTLTYIIDAGTARERSYGYRARDIVKVDTVDEFYAPSSFSQPYPVATFLGKLPPLPPGQHTYTLVLQMSARSCDGLGAEDFNCIGPGAVALCTLPFTVEQRKAVRR